MTATAALVAALITGCGGDDTAKTSSANASTPAVTATPDSQFVAQAEAICKGANEKEAALGAPGIDWIHSEYFTDLDFLVDFHAVGRAALRDLRKLTPPEEDRDRYAEALRSIAKMLRGVNKQIAAVRADRGSDDAIEIYERGYIDLAAVGGPLGFTECLGIVL